jgi:hypothetical protein
MATCLVIRSYISLPPPPNLSHNHCCRTVESVLTYRHSGQKKDPYSPTFLSILVLKHFHHLLVVMRIGTSFLDHVTEKVIAKICFFPPFPYHVATRRTLITFSRYCAVPISISQFHVVAKSASSSSVLTTIAETSALFMTTWSTKIFRYQFLNHSFISNSPSHGPIPDDDNFSDFRKLEVVL